MKILCTFFLILGPFFANAGELTSEPFGYAEDATAAYAEGSSDMEPFGSDGCGLTRDDGTNLEIECSGTRTVLVFGGYENTGQFTCNFHFQKRTSDSYEVLAGTETCQ